MFVLVYSKPTTLNKGRRSLNKCLRKQNLHYMETVSMNRQVGKHSHSRTSFIVMVLSYNVS